MVFSRLRKPAIIVFFFFNDTATTEIYTLSLHDALPVSRFLLIRVTVTCSVITSPSSRQIVIGFSDPSDRKSTRLNSSHSQISYAVFCLKKKITVATWRQYFHTNAA